MALQLNDLMAVPAGFVETAELIDRLDECFLMGLGNDNVIILDLSNSEIERIEVDFAIRDM